MNRFYMVIIFVNIIIIIVINKMKIRLLTLVVYLLSTLPGCHSVHNRISHRLKVNPNTPSPIQMHYVPHAQSEGKLKAIMEMG